jgi:hypothetical protein
MTTRKNTLTSKIVFSLSLIVFLFWLQGWVINVYKVAIAGAFYEIIWLPVIALTFILPVLILVLWFKEKFDFRSLYFYSLLLLTATVLFLALATK